MKVVCPQLVPSVRLFMVGKARSPGVVKDRGRLSRDAWHKALDHFEEQTRRTLLSPIISTL
eukprot:12517886-Prorocentrum_lima.AAC.1